MRTLIVVDDLMELLPSKNRVIQSGLQIYVQYLCGQIRQLSQNLKAEGDQPVFVAAHKEVLDRLDFPIEKLDYGIWFDSIEFAAGGRISARLADPFEKSNHMRILCPELFTSKVSVPQIASIRFRISICYHAINNYLMLQNMVTKYSIEKIVMLSGTSEIEKIATAIAARARIPVKVTRPNGVGAKLKNRFSAYVYFRDRKLHALESFGRADITESHEPLPGKKIICMAPAHSLHFRMLIPLAQSLNRSRQYEAVFLLQDTSLSFIPKLKELGIRYRLLTGLRKKELRRDFERQVNELSKAWDELVRTPDFQKEFQSEGIDWFSILASKWQWYFKFSYAEVCVLQNRIVKALEELKPAAVVTVSDSRFFDAGSAAVAKKLGIPSFLYSQTYLYDTDAINEYETSDCVLTVGENMKKYILSRGRVSAERIVTVGDIRIELEKEKATLEEKARIFDSLGIPPEKKIFIIASFYISFGYSNHDKKRFFEMARDTVKKHPDMTLVIKAHPNENQEVLENFVHDLGMDEFVVTKSYSIFSLFGIASGLLTLTSLSALEAMAFDVPVVVLTLPDRNYDYYIPLRTSGAVACCASSDELGDTMRRIVNDNAFLKDLLKREREYVSQFIDQSDTKASERILHVLNQKLSAQLIS